ncbi:MAG TPA: TonB-dependent receptor [Terriglobia bacterium]|nr:TonB-dependent receptor [Terriglobia bacterium]
MKPKTNSLFTRLRPPLMGAALILFLLIGSQVPSWAQQTVGAITGTVLDSSGAAVQDAVVRARNVATNFEVTTHSKSNGSYSISNLPVGTYELKFTKEGFETETHTEVLVTSDRTTTIDGALKVGAVSTTVEVTAVALRNQTDATNGYVVDQITIQDTPLGTGSFTQLAILAPGVHADFLSGAGANAGLGNQAIFANGNRDTSNSFSLNGVSTNNLFNGNSTSQVGENRFVLNTGENFGAGGVIQTSTSVYGAIGQALPTPPTDAIQEIAVNAAMFDATQGNNSGAHISVLTKSGTNQLHGTAWEEWQNSDMNAAPFFYNADNLPTPFLNRNMFGATLGGPIKKDKLFYFLSYQGIRVSDVAESTKDAVVPLGLTNDRSVGGIVAAVNSTYGTTSFTAGQVSSVAMNMLQAKLPNGQYLVPTPQITNGNTAYTLGYDAVVQGPNSLAPVNQGIANIDYQLSEKDHLSAKYYVQDNPTTNPFGAVGSLLGFAQQLSAGSDVGTITNTTILSPSVTWEQHVGFTRLRAYAATSQDFTPSQMGMSLLGSKTFPQFEITTMDPTVGYGLEFGPSTSFGNAGMDQNQWEFESSLNMVKGRHTIAIGGQLDRTQLNIINNNVNTDSVYFEDFQHFVEGSVYGGDAFAGSANRYYRSNTAGAYINDNFKIRSNLTLTGGLRWDFDGPLTEKYGKLTGFNPALYAYDAATDTITGSGLEFAGNNPNHTAGASNSLMTQHQWGFAPRIGIAWSPTSKLTVRAGYGIYFDRGELFSYLSPSAGSGFNGPFGVTLAPPFVEPIAAARGASFAAPFGTTPPSPPAANPASFLTYLPNLSQTSSGYWPSGNLFGPFLFGGYDIANKLPNTQNWTLDFQYQLSSNWLFDVAYVGNRGVHEILPVPFNQSLLATPTNPVNGQMYSYGGLSPLSACNAYYSGATPLDLEPLCPPPYYAGNAEVRVPYLGYDMNSVQYEAEGISNYHALQVNVRKRLSNGLQFTASYTYSHALDEQSGLGLFVTGNNPLVPRANYGSADFDQTHVFLINYSYTLPTFAKNNKALGYAVNGWTIGGQTVAQSGQPYSVYDYSGSVAGIYYGTYDEISNPIVPLAPGVTPKQAEFQGTTGVNAGKPVLNASDFSPQFLQPGQDGVPPCDTTGCDNWESVFGTTGRNTFRGPFQVRFDMSLAKQFPIIKDRFRLRFEVDAFNIFNQPDFDTPNNDVNFFPYYEGPPSIPPLGDLGQIQHTIGSSRFMQLGLHLIF